MPPRKPVKPKPKPVGRPSKYRSEFAEQARKLCLLGATDADLAEFFEVEESTLNNWKSAHPEFLESVKRGKTQADMDVADRLYQKAMGYEHDDVHVSSYQGEVTLTPIRKIYAPDPAAAIFWLKNRQRVKWRDRTETEVTGKDGGPLETKASLDVSALPVDVLTAIMKAKDATQPS